ncbi:hypothetical protein K1719_011061 [Acacia pycnantha]|nr:hypothetical protein K1719_011061 [Acacia pycnantha]
MDKSRIKLPHNSPAYLTRLTTFLDFAFSHTSCNGKIGVHGEIYGMRYGDHLPRSSQVRNQLDQDDPLNEAIHDAFGFQGDNFTTEVQGKEPAFFKNDAAREFFSLMDEADCPLYQDIPTTFYEAKKIINRLGLNYEKIDACPNDCMLYWGDNACKDTFKKCHTSRFRTFRKGKKQKKKPAKILKYFPLKARLQRLFMSSKTAEHMRWYEAN